MTPKLHMFVAQPALRRHGRNQIIRPTHSQQNDYRLVTILIFPAIRILSEQARDMRDSASRAQHYHDLALEFLVMTRFASAADIQEKYRMMGQHYLARAGAELARAKMDRVCNEP